MRRVVDVIRQTHAKNLSRAFGALTCEELEAVSGKRTGEGDIISLSGGKCEELKALSGKRTGITWKPLSLH